VVNPFGMIRCKRGLPSYSWLNLQERPNVGPHLSSPDLAKSCEPGQFPQECLEILAQSPIQ
jgi:hypothetical protein